MCCRTTPLPRSPPTPLPRSPDYTPEAASAAVDTPEYPLRRAQPMPAPAYTIYTRTRGQEAEMTRRGDRLRAMLADGIGPFNTWNVIVVPNQGPPARVCEPQFSVFTRTRTRTKRAAEHGSFPMCPSPFSKRQRSS